MREKLLLFILFISINAYGQQLKLEFNPISIPSPNATSLGIFGVIPVNYYTGIPDISIPLYTLVEGSISVPIVLKYHSAGFRPNQYPSWVGLGWALQAGGMITRNVKTLPDEKDYHGINTVFEKWKNLGYFYNTYLFRNDRSWYHEPIYDTTNIYDSEPDEFIFNFNGISGKFYLDHNRQWQVYSDQELKVECTENDIASVNTDYYIKNKKPFDNGGNMFFRFKIFTSDGTQYVFGGNRKAIEFTRSESSNIYDIPTATTWNLTQIISPEGDDTIRFEYDRADNDLILITYKASNILQYNLSIETGCNSVIGELLKYNTQILEPSYLKGIYSRNQKISINSTKSDALPLEINKDLTGRINTFFAPYHDIKFRSLTSKNTGPEYYNTDDLSRIGRKLTQIDIYYNYPGNNSIYKSFIFKYTENNSERLKLSSVEEKAANTSNYPIYQFDYYKSSLAEPSYETVKTDHWGFYNNVESINYIINDKSAFINNKKMISNFENAKNASSDPNVFLMGMLKKIIYPTGGTTTLEYECNNYSEYIHRQPKVSGEHIIGIESIELKNLDKNATAGGLRIKRIISTPEESANSIVKEYIYINGFGKEDAAGITKNKLSSGQLQQDYPISADTVCINQYKSCLLFLKQCKDSCTNAFKHNPRGLANCIDHCPICNNNCLADNIHLYNQIGWFVVNSKIVGSFDKFSSNPFFPLFDKNGNHIVYTEVIEKLNNNAYTKYYYNFSSNQNKKFLDEPPYAYKGNNYYTDLISRINERGTLKLEQHFNNNGEKIRQVNYYYNSDPLRFKKNIRLKQAFYLSINCEGSPKDIESSNHNYIYYYSSYLEKKVEIDYTPTDSIIKTTTYKYGGLNDKLLKEESTEQSDGSAMISRYTYSTDLAMPQNSADDMVLAIASFQQKHIIAPVEIIILNKKNNVTSLIEGKVTLYKTFHTNVTKPEKILMFESEKPVSEGLFKPVQIDNAGKFIYDASYYKERMRFNIYDTKGNLNEFQKTGDIPVSLLYGYNYSYPIAKLSNISYQTLVSTLANSSVSIKDLNVQYYSRDDYLKKFETLYTLFPSSQIETYTYDVIKGITSQTNENRQTTYYIYDNFGRLSSILDQDKNILKTFEYHYKQ